MTFAARLIDHTPAPIELDVLLEQLQLAAFEVLGRGAQASLTGPVQPNAPWTARAQTNAQQVRAEGATPATAARELARELLSDPRSDGVESRELRRLLMEEGL
jgi:hypothetical protein